ncbi:hypothetical protein A4H97_11445 [Niastella yeongjuensis]|uniref:Aspartyl protease n=1 Tax=Niastella yeongjuensis TaxID=354355 RepID=A0A1V9E9L1_9BACT|nr:hypothetical protein [Niastella yeongjuensis]OQP42772.1 hypothetical protein A4H97_11445 [Niastella yeongjuensis]SEO53269.1 hypothetical protein SAMN05660816_02957 [Niastella yeongjuensis]
MRKTILYTCLFLISFYQTVRAQEKPTVIPFELTPYNNISIQVILNGKDTVHLMFHTAAGSVTLIEESIKKLGSLHFSGADTVKSWGGGGNTSRHSENNTLQIGHLTWEQEPIWEDKYSGPGTDGKFGPGLFKNKAIEIDFDKKVIVLHNHLPAKSKHYTKLKTTFNNDMLFVEATCNTGSQTITNNFLIHTGHSGSMLLDDQFVASNKLGEQLKVIDTKELKDSYGHILKVQKAILPGFTLGNTTLKDIPIGFFEGTIGRQKMSILGGDVLKRFNIIIDASRAFVFLKPNKFQKTPYTS